MSDAPSAAPMKSGRFLVRIPKSLHAALVEEADREGVSLNTLAVSRLSAPGVVEGLRKELERCWMWRDFYEQQYEQRRRESNEDYERSKVLQDEITELKLMLDRAMTPPGVDGQVMLRALRELGLHRAYNLAQDNLVLASQLEEFKRILRTREDHLASARRRQEKHFLHDIDLLHDLAVARHEATVLRERVAELERRVEAFEGTDQPGETA
jgi:HicB family